MIDSLPGFHVRADNIEFHGILRKSRTIKWIQHIRDIVITEFCAIQVAGQQPGAPAGVMPVSAEAQIIAQCSARLSRLEIAAESRACGNTDHAVQLQMLFTHNIQDCRGIQAAHGAAFQHQSGFTHLLPPDAGPEIHSRLVSPYRQQASLRFSAQPAHPPPWLPVQIPPDRM